MPTVSSCRVTTHSRGWGKPYWYSLISFCQLFKDFAPASLPRVGIFNNELVTCYARSSFIRVFAAVYFERQDQHGKTNGSLPFHSRFAFDLHFKWDFSNALLTCHLSDSYWMLGFPCSVTTFWTQSHLFALPKDPRTRWITVNKSEHVGRHLPHAVGGLPMSSTANSNPFSQSMWGHS